MTCNCLNPDIRPDGGRQGAFKHKFLVMLLSVSQIDNFKHGADCGTFKYKDKSRSGRTAVYWEVSNRLQCAWQFLNAVTSVYHWEADSRHRSVSLCLYTLDAGTPVCCITLPAALQTAAACVGVFAGCERCANCLAAYIWHAMMDSTALARP